jgi:hypothetical protein
MAHSDSVLRLTAKLRAQNDVRPVLLLGAGASFSSGVPTAAECVRRIAKRYYSEIQLGGAVPPEQVRLTEWQGWLHGQSWFVKGDEHLAENFPLVVEHLLTPMEYRKKVMLDLIVPDEIGKGYRKLAELVKRGLISTILTTNFDTCLPAALAPIRPHVAHIAEVNRHPGDLQEFGLWQKAQIVWLHGKAEQYSDRNAKGDLASFDATLAKRLYPLLLESPLIVIGYRGSEPSIMEHVLGAGAQETQNFKNGVFWCTRKGEALHPNVETFRRVIGGNFQLLEIDGFDELLEDLDRTLINEDRYLHTHKAGAADAAAPFDDTPIADAAFADLDDDLMIAVLKEYCQKLGRPEVTRDTLHGLLREQGLMVSSKNGEFPTTGCVLLFARNPARWFPHAVVSTSIDGKKRRVFGGNLITQYRDLLEWLSDKTTNPTLKVKRRVTHEEKQAYPDRALVELLVNLLVHRDYERTAPATIAVASGQSITFANPGGLPEAIAAQMEPDDDGQFKPRASVSSLRNRALCDVFFGMRAMERAGTGLVDVEQMLLEHGGASQFKHESSGARFSARVSQPLASAGSKDVARDARPSEIYVLNFIPFISIPDMVSVIKLRAPWNERPRDLPLDEAGTFAVQGDNYLWSFVPLPILRSIFGSYADQEASRAWRRSELEADPDRRRVLSNLLRRHFERHLRGFAVHGLLIENGKQKGRRAYFEGNDGKARWYVYDSPTRKNIQRGVVKQRGPDGFRAWFENEGFGYEVAQMDGVWGVRIKPFYMFTGRDAKKPLPSFARTARATRRMKLDRNQNVENDLTFWGRFLSRGAQTINIGQHHVEDLLLGGSFLTVEVIEEEDDSESRQGQNPKAA